LQDFLEQKFVFKDNGAAMAVMGHNDCHIELFERNFNGKIVVRNNEATVSGLSDEVKRIIRVMAELEFLHCQGNAITSHEVLYSIDLVQTGREEMLHNMFSDTILVTAKGRHVKPKTLGQRIYLEAIKQNEITFGIGPAGTGKTYLAVVMAVAALHNKEVEKIILTRPAVEAGEKLGFLPGDLQDKVDPYLRPLYDALFDILGAETYQKFMAKNIIEVAPLAYMRGRTLDDSFVILDEAQNTTAPQMKMFLTRLGFGSKMVITGDLTQVDLPRGVMSGLLEASEVLKDVKGVKIIELKDSDVIRHEVVARIIRAYDKYNSQRLQRGK
jgi:phosphate starvation-inducible PhoH-like protein